MIRIVVIELHYTLKLIFPIDEIEVVPSLGVELDRLIFL